MLSLHSPFNFLSDCHWIPFFLFQGMLSPIVKVPSAAIPSEEALEALKGLSADPQNKTWYISSRDGIVRSWSNFGTFEECRVFGGAWWVL